MDVYTRYQKANDHASEMKQIWEKLKTEIYEAYPDVEGEYKREIIKTMYSRAYAILTGEIRTYFHLKPYKEERNVYHYQIPLRYLGYGRTDGFNIYFLPLEKIDLFFPYKHFWLKAVKEKYNAFEGSLEEYTTKFSNANDSQKMLEKWNRLIKDEKENTGVIFTDTQLDIVNCEELGVKDVLIITQRIK